MAKSNCTKCIRSFQTSFDKMEEESDQVEETTIYHMEEQGLKHETNKLVHEPLLNRDHTISASTEATMGAKVPRIESLNYELQTTGCLSLHKEKEVFLFTYSFINIYRYMMGFFFMSGVNLLLTLVATILCTFFAPTAAGPGAPEIKAYLNGVDTPKMFGATTMFVKIIGTIGVVSAGLDLGKEGPLIHIGACIASLIGQGGPDNYQIKWGWMRYFNNDRDRRDIITCGASSGVCAAFRAPVGGVLFSLEEVATWWRSALLWRTFFSTAIVVVVLRVSIEYCKSGNCGLFGEDGLIMFDVSSVSVSYRVADVIPIISIGIVGGVLGSLYNYLLQKILGVYSLVNEKGKTAKILLSLTVALFTSACQYGLPFLVSCKPCDPSLIDYECPNTGRMGNFKQFNCPNGHYNDLATILLTTNDDAVRNIFSVNTSTQYDTTSLLLFFALYCILGIITFGIAVPTGLFLPILLMGSAYGRMLGMAMEPWSKIDQGLYAVLGAASLMAGSMRMTVSICVIFLELTDNLLLLPITMIVLLIAKSVGDYFNPSIYEIILDLKGLPFLEAHPKPWMRNITVGDLAAVKPPVVTLSGIEKVGRILEVLRNTTHNGFPVVDNIDVLQVGPVSEVKGIILRDHLLLVLKKKWFLKERRRTKEWEIRGKISYADVAERWGKKDEVAVTDEEAEMYVDLHPLTNTTPYTVVETMSVAKAMVQFREVGLRHMLVLPKYHGPAVPPLVGILTRQDLRAHNILKVFPHIENSKQVKEEAKSQ
ncbi:chloride channel protein CLC-b-like [Rutidosis leptorrhynchoides]|uniref:chloride channel protein CLC-b-like n=1 Tax=Rutidosis leptorrhynchoides TaxID=125765 RepID=UPI003A99ECE9